MPHHSSCIGAEKTGVHRCLWCNRSARSRDTWEAGKECPAALPNQDAARRNMPRRVGMVVETCERLLTLPLQDGELADDAPDEQEQQSHSEIEDIGGHGRPLRIVSRGSSVRGWTSMVCSLSTEHRRTRQRDSGCLDLRHHERGFAVPHNRQDLQAALSRLLPHAKRGGCLTQMFCIWLRLIGVW